MSGLRQSGRLKAGSNRSASAVARLFEDPLPDSCGDAISDTATHVRDWRISHAKACEEFEEGARLMR